METKFTKLCPACDNTMEYKRKSSLYSSIKDNAICRSCYYKTISANLSGKPKSELHKKKLSQAKIGVILSEEHKKKLSQANVGKIRTDEQKKNYSESKKGDKNPAKQNWVKDKIRNSVNQVYIDNPEVKDKISISLKQYYIDNPNCLDNRKPFSINQFSTTYTKPELKVKNILEELNVIHTHNDKIGRFWTDFLFLVNKVIEVDGEYWHDDVKDKIKDDFLTNKGFIILRIKEKELKNILDVKQKIINFINL